MKIKVKVKEKAPETVEIDTEFIKLDSLLKSIIRRTAANEELEDRHNACLPGAD